MIKSMTGYGRGTFSKEGREYTVEIKTVNHRYSDVSVKMPRQLAYLEDNVRKHAAGAVSRGKIDVYISFDNHSEKGRSVLFDKQLADMYIQELGKLKSDYNLKDDMGIYLVSRLPDVLRIKNSEDENLIWEEMRDALESALSSLLVMRQKEGESLKSDILQRVENLHGFVQQIEERSPVVVEEYKKRLETRLKDLLGDIKLDEARIAMEIAIFVDRCSIAEEVTRLFSHLEQVKQTLNLAHPVGKKLDFIIQEINRETNTIGSKANDLKITQLVLDVKDEVEKIREQIQNIE